jgi:tetratricopeptide (TPR) repeat protein
MISPDGIENASSSDLLSSSSSSPEYWSDGEDESLESTNEPSTITPNLDLLPDAEKRKRRKYERKRPRRVSEEELYKMRKKRQEEYEGLRKQRGKVNIWDFESLFPEPVWDDETIRRDLYEVSDRDAKAGKDKFMAGLKRSNITSTLVSPKVDIPLRKELSKLLPPKLVAENNNVSKESSSMSNIKSSVAIGGSNSTEARVNSTKVDRSLTRMVEDRLYGFRRDQMGDFEYDTSLMGDGAVKFRDGVRLGNALKVNCDRLNYFAKKELAKGKLEEAEELYEMAIEMSPRDGRAYLGLSRIAQRRRDFKYAKECLKSGIANSLSDKTWGANGMKVTDTGANPFLLQALGTLEERMGHLSEAERLYIAAARSRPSHAAAWVALAQLRCRKLRQGPDAGRICYRTAEVELMRAGLKPSSHVYTAWASLEWKAGQIKRARELFRQALDIDPKCSAAWNQLGVMEAQVEHWDEAEQCFQSALKFDGRNSRVLQAYAIMETKRPDSDSRKALGLFERALKANPRDGGVYQAYALFVAKLGDIDAARGL